MGDQGCSAGADHIKATLVRLMTAKGARFFSNHSSTMVNGKKLKNVYTGCRIERGEYYELNDPVIEGA